jgi:uncharacterized membrane protein YidH (DUF202 family)
MTTRFFRLLLRCYPRDWRERYGEELEGLLAQMSDDGRSALRMGVDILRTGASERLRSSGLSGTEVPHEARTKASALLVLCAWATFAVAGATIQRFSEHWRRFTPSSSRPLPTGAYEILTVAAVAAGLLILLGGICAVPNLLAFMRRGGWRESRIRVRRALLVSLVALTSGSGLVLWAHRLSDFQRNGHDSRYGLAFVTVGLLLVAALAAWIVAVVATARQMNIPVAVLKLEVGIAAGVSVAMLAATVGAVTWWTLLATRAPWALAEQAHDGESALTLEFVPALSMMALASLFALAATWRAWRAASAMRDAKDARGCVSDI